MPVQFINIRTIYYFIPYRKIIRCEVPTWAEINTVRNIIFISVRRCLKCQDNI